MNEVKYRLYNLNNLEVDSIVSITQLREDLKDTIRTLYIITTDKQALTDTFVYFSMDEFLKIDDMGFEELKQLWKSCFDYEVEVYSI